MESVNACIADKDIVKKEERLGRVWKFCLIQGQKQDGLMEQMKRVNNVDRSEDCIKEPVSVLRNMRSVRCWDMRVLHQRLASVEIKDNVNTGDICNLKCHHRIDR